MEQLEVRETLPVAVLVDWENVEVHIELYDTLPDAVAYRAAVYRSGLVSDGLKQIWRPGRVNLLVYENHPLFNFIPRRAFAPPQPGTLIRGTSIPSPCPTDSHQREK